jgi:hypothetical protein
LLSAAVSLVVADAADRAADHDDAEQAEGQ